jgi:RNA recognition motif-containing protein
VIFRLIRGWKGKMNIYVGNLAPSVTEDDLRRAFMDFGQVTTITMTKDPLTGAGRGFGFVDMPDNAAARQAIAGLDGKSLQGRMILVLETRILQERPEDRKPAGRAGGYERYGDSRSHLEVSSSRRSGADTHRAPLGARRSGNR